MYTTVSPCLSPSFTGILEAKGSGEVIWKASYRSKAAMRASWYEPIEVDRKDTHLLLKLNTNTFHPEHCCMHTLTMREKMRIMDFSNKRGKKGDMVNTKALVDFFLFSTTSGNITGTRKNSRGDHIISSATVQRQFVVHQIHW